MKLLPLTSTVRWTFIEFIEMSNSSSIFFAQAGSFIKDVFITFVSCIDLTISFTSILLPFPSISLFSLCCLAVNWNGNALRLV